MESNRAVLGIPGDGRSGISICIVVHVMKAVCKCVEMLLVFAGYKQHSLEGFTSARMYPDRCISPCSGWSGDVGSSIHQAPFMLPQ